MPDLLRVACVQLESGADRRIRETRPSLVDCRPDAYRVRV